VIELAAGSSRGIRLLSQGGPDDGPHQFTLPHASIMQLSLPLVGRVAAGSPILAQEHISHHYACDPALFSSKPDYLLKVRGLSMRDAGIFDGDLLAVQKKNEAKDGQIVVARLGDDVTVKRWKRRPDGVELIAENPDYENIFVASGSDDFALEGIAVGLIRSGEL
jgi:repressor LexA